MLLKLSNLPQSLPRLCAASHLPRSLPGLHCLHSSWQLSPGLCSVALRLPTNIKVVREAACKVPFYLLVPVMKALHAASLGWHLKAQTIRSARRAEAALLSSTSPGDQHLATNAPIYQRNDCALIPTSLQSASSSPCQARSPLHRRVVTARSVPRPLRQPLCFPSGMRDNASDRGRLPSPSLGSLRSPVG